MSDDGLLSWAGKAVEGKLCTVNCCTANPIATRNGRRLCAKHRDFHDHMAFGEPCDRCGSTTWVKTPDAKTAAWCAQCDYATYDETIFDHSW